MKEKKKNKRKKKRKIFRKILVILLIAIAIFLGVFAYRVQKNGGGLSGIIATAVGHDENTKKNLGEFRCLLLGISTDQDGVTLTDTIMVASYNPNTQKATLLSIPRDTFIGKDKTKATGYYKINAVYSRKSRANETLEVVNEITGLDLEYYAVVRTEALIKLVDVIGGVTFNVPIDMYYTDSSQDLVIDLKKGEQLIDGEKAEQLLRFRKNNDGTSYPAEYGDNDIGRMKTQRDFITQVIKQTMKIGNIFKLGQILDVAKENLETNIDFNILKDYIPYAVEFNTANLLTATLPGDVPDMRQTNNCSVFIYNKAETKKIIEELFVERDKTEEELEQEGNIITNKKDIKIEVLNGSGEKQKLDKIVKDLKGAGYKVGSQGTTNEVSKTVIIKDKDVSTVITDELEQILGIGIIQPSESTGKTENITITIGKDYN